MNNKYLLLVATAGIIFTSCSLFGNTSNSYPTIPLPPQKIDESNTVVAVKESSPKSGSSTPKSSPAIIYQGKRTIQEDRSNGTVTQIKVDNGNNLPDYYMYPSQQQDLNTNSTPGKDLSTPSWQISW